MLWLRTDSKTTASYLQTSQPFLWACSSRHSTPRHKFRYKSPQSETCSIPQHTVCSRSIPQYTVCFTYIIRHGPCSNSLRGFNYLSGISIFTSQLVWDTRLPLVECGRACHAPAFILVHPIRSPTTTVVIHPVSIPSNPSALFCKPDEWLESMTDTETAYRVAAGLWPRRSVQIWLVLRKNRQWVPPKFRKMSINDKTSDYCRWAYTAHSARWECQI